MDVIYFAGGCFWGTEHFFKQVTGVTATAVGYANSSVPNPTYKQVCSGATGAAETVRVEFDPQVISVQGLVQLYFMTIDPFSVDRQGGDVGTQYRTGIYYTSEAQRAEVWSAVSAEVERLGRAVAVEVLPLENFYPAEDYHQDYLDVNPGGYCHVNPALFEVARRFRQGAATPGEYQPKPDSELREELTPLQYFVARHSATEPPFENEYWQEDRPGIYVDVVSGEPLFTSRDKFASSCGWPAFARPIAESKLAYNADHAHGMSRTEVRSRVGDTHLGHVFNDGPRSLGGVRYCINSAALRFIPRESMEAEGYASYLPLL